MRLNNNSMAEHILYTLFHYFIWFVGWMIGFFDAWPAVSNDVAGWVSGERERSV